MSINVLATQSVIPDAIKLRRPKRSTAVKNRHENRYYPTGNSNYGPLDNIRIEMSSTSEWCLPSTAVLHFHLVLDAQLQSAAAAVSPVQQIGFDLGGCGVINRVRTSIQNLLLEDTGQGANSIFGTQLHHTADASHYNGVETAMTGQWKYAPNQTQAETLGIAAPGAYSNTYTDRLQADTDFAIKSTVANYLGIPRRAGAVGPLHKAGINVAIPLAHFCAWARTKQAFPLRSVGSVQFDISLASFAEAVYAAHYNSYDDQGAQSTFDQVGGNLTYRVENVYMTADVIELNPVLLQSFDQIFRSAEPGNESIIVYDTLEIMRQNKSLPIGSMVKNSYVFNKATQSLKDIIIKTQRQSSLSGANQVFAMSVGGSENLCVSGAAGGAFQDPLDVNGVRGSQGVRLQIGSTYYPMPQQVGGGEGAVIAQFGGVPATMAQNRKALGHTGSVNAGCLVGALGMAYCGNNENWCLGDWATFFNFEALNESESYEIDGLDTTLNSQVNLTLEQGLPAGAPADDCVVTLGIVSSKYLMLSNNQVKVSS